VSASQPWADAFDGRQHIGAVAMRAGKYLATDANGKKLGTYATSKLALAAIAQAKPKRTLH
jgi:hypothetical protein